MSQTIADRKLMNQTILVVDDDGPIRLLVQEILTQAGYQVLTAQHGPECLAIVAQQVPQLIILDLDMPFMGGLEVLRALRRKRALRKLPVIILTGQTATVNMLDAWKTGAERFLHKPVSREALLHAVQAILPQGSKIK